MGVKLDGVVVRHTVRPLESLYERSPVLFAGFVMLSTLMWIILASLFSLPFWAATVGTLVVLIAAVLTPHWFEIRNYLIEGNRTLVLDDRGLQVEGILIPWSELHFRRHGDRSSSISLWEVGLETIIVTFEHKNHTFSAFLGVRFKPLAPIVHAETLTKTLSEEEMLRLESLISEHIEDQAKTNLVSEELPF